MPINVQCTQCGKTLKVPDTAAGKRGKCPCGAILNIPAAGGIQTAPAPVAPTRPSSPGGAKPAIAQGGGGGSGSVTAPETFKKLFNAYLLCVGLAIGLGLIFAVIITVVVGPAVSSVGDSFKAQLKYQQEHDEWVNGGRRGPEPQPPSTSPPSGGGGFAAVIAGPLGYCGLSLIGIAATVVGLMFVYKAWALIEDGNPRTSPGQAIGFLFIPIFQYYWMFVAYWGLAQDLNKYAQERGIQARPAAEGMVLWGLILTLLGCTMPIGVILLLIGFNSIKNSCMDIAAAKIG